MDEEGLPIVVRPNNIESDQPESWFSLCWADLILSKCAIRSGVRTYFQARSAA